MTGRYCTVEPLDVERHAAALYAAVSLDREGRNWTYVPSGPFDAADGCQRVSLSSLTSPLLKAKFIDGFGE
jgi:hypothetical protein